MPSAYLERRDFDLNDTTRKEENALVVNVAEMNYATVAVHSLTAGTTTTFAIALEGGITGRDWEEIASTTPGSVGILQKQDVIGYRFARAVLKTAEGSALLGHVSIFAEATPT